MYVAGCVGGEESLQAFLASHQYFGLDKTGRSSFFLSFVVFIFILIPIFLSFFSFFFFSSSSFECDRSLCAVSGVDAYSQ